MMFLIKHWKVIIPSAALVVILLSSAFWYHGEVRYQKGVSDTQAANLVAQIQADEDARKDRVKNETKFKSMPVDSIDSYGSSRGWMREYTDR